MVPAPVHRQGGRRGHRRLRAGLPRGRSRAGRKGPDPRKLPLRVCSAGLERVLKRPSDFEQFLGAAVLVKLYQPKNGMKEFAGTLTGYENGKVTVEMNGTSFTFEKNEVALVRLRVEF